VRAQRRGGALFGFVCRFTRLTDEFSKRLANHSAAIRVVGLLLQSVPRPRNAAHDASDGAGRHGSQSGRLEKLIAAAQEPSDVPPLPPVERPDTLGGRTPFKPYVISGGRAAPDQARKKGNKVDASYQEQKMTKRKIILDCFSLGVSV
jgi:hypothetical protein